MSLSQEPRDDASGEQVLRRAFELGVTFFDTADRYGTGHNERLVGRVLADRQHEIVVATKFGFVGSPNDPKGVVGRPEYVGPACDRSLRRLGVEIIDLYYLHRVDPAVAIEETIGAMSELVAAGKVRALGLSEASPATIRRAHATHPLAALQTEYSLWSRDPEREILATCRELGITFVAYSPLGIGFLTGAIRQRGDVPAGNRLARSERTDPANLERNLRLVDGLRAMAAGLGCSPGQLALAWLLAQGLDIVPIPGTRTVAHLEENLGAAQLDLAPEHLGLLDHLFAPDVTAGRRKSAAGLAIVDR
jgi:aryl-alcohol dehydrogenase-like predicted oxidoreductase